MERLSWVCENENLNTNVGCIIKALLSKRFVMKGVISIIPLERGNRIACIVDNSHHKFNFSCNDICIEETDNALKKIKEYINKVKWKTVKLYIDHNDIDHGKRMVVDILSHNYPEMCVSSFVKNTGSPFHREYELLMNSNFKLYEKGDEISSLFDRLDGGYIGTNSLTPFVRSMCESGSSGVEKYECDDVLRNSRGGYFTNSIEFAHHLRCEVSKLNSFFALRSGNDNLDIMEQYLKKWELKYYGQFGTSHFHVISGSIIRLYKHLEEFEICFLQKIENGYLPFSRVSRVNCQSASEKSQSLFMAIMAYKDVEGEKLYAPLIYMSLEGDIFVPFNSFVQRNGFMSNYASSQSVSLPSFMCFNMDEAILFRIVISDMGYLSMIFEIDDEIHVVGNCYGVTKNDILERCGHHNDKWGDHQSPTLGTKMFTSRFKNLRDSKIIITQKYINSIPARGFFDVECKNGKTVNGLFSNMEVYSYVNVIPEFFQIKLEITDMINSGLTNKSYFIKINQKTIGHIICKNYAKWTTTLESLHSKGFFLSDISHSISTQDFVDHNTLSHNTIQECDRSLKLLEEIDKLRVTRVKRVKEVVFE
jgi:hypothetical protein